MGSIIVGLIMVVAGASGHFVLKGTGSSGALVGVGIVIMIFGLLKSGGASDKTQKAIQSKKNKELVQKLTNEIKSLRNDGLTESEIESELVGKGLKREIVSRLMDMTERTDEAVKDS